MFRFAALYDALDRSTATNDKVTALVDYFATAPPQDAAWAVFFLSGERLQNPVKSANLAAWAREAAGVSEWMYNVCYESVGDRAETIALLIDAAPNRTVAQPWNPSLTTAVEWLETLRGSAEVQQKAQLLGVWSGLDMRRLFLLTKLMTGALRVGVAKRLLVRALAEWSGVSSQVIFHRLMGDWRPSEQSFVGLFAEDTIDADRSRPFPYFLASPLADSPESLGDAGDWLAEWKWDGIRGQLVRRAGATWLWSRGEELVTDQYPEIAEAAAALSDGTVLDGEILAYQGGTPLPFAQLQRRIGRKRVGAKILNDVPCVFMAYDQLEQAGQDMRPSPLEQRRQSLQHTVRGLEGRFPTSELVPFAEWVELARLRGQSRTRGVEGLMLKRLASPYRVGRVRGDWWKWKIDPLEIDAVLVYAQPGHGRRASLYTDYTFAVWGSERELVPIAKAYSGLEDAEIRELDRWIRANTLEKFGPVRAVKPQFVFELHFENVARSARHKSGLAVRFPRIARWRRDRSVADAAHLDELQAMIRAETDAPD